MESSSNPGLSAHCQLPSSRYTRARRGAFELELLNKPVGAIEWIFGELESSMAKFCYNKLTANQSMLQENQNQTLEHASIIGCSCVLIF